MAVATALDRSTFERLVTPSVEGGQSVAAFSHADLGMKPRKRSRINGVQYF